jgi:hypothetical protein
MDHAQLTILLDQSARGDRASASKLLEVVYEQLRALAGSYSGGRQASHTLHATALVHEVFIKLVGAENQNFESRGHFFAVAATAMRQILMDHARRKRAAKRGGGDPGLEAHVDSIMVSMGGRDDEMDAEALDDALTELAANNERMYRVVELRFFGGLEVHDVANLLGISKSTAEADWRAARAWLNMKLRAAKSP